MQLYKYFLQTFNHKLENDVTITLDSDKIHPFFAHNKAFLAWRNYWRMRFLDISIVHVWSNSRESFTIRFYLSYEGKLCYILDAYVYTYCDIPPTVTIDFMDDKGKLSSELIENNTTIEVCCMATDLVLSHVPTDYMLKVKEAVRCVTMKKIMIPIRDLLI